MSKKSYRKILDHPDKEEIINKLLIGLSVKDINQWMEAKYSNVSEAKFIISENMLSSFKDDYLDIYSLIQSDLTKTKTALANNTNTSDVDLALQNSPSYKEIMIKSVSQEMDIRAIIKNLCLAIENRLSTVFDVIQADPQNINTRLDRLLIEYTEALGNILEKYYKFTEAPANNLVQHNVTLHVVDQHISVFHDVIKEILSQMDLETSLYFMEVFNEKMSKLKPPKEEGVLNPEIRLAEVKLLNETINKKINE